MSYRNLELRCHVPTLAMVCYIVLDLQHHQPDRLPVMHYIHSRAAIYQLYCNFLVRRAKKRNPEREVFQTVAVFNDIKGSVRVRPGRGVIPVLVLPCFVLILLAYYKRDNLYALFEIHLYFVI